MSFESHLAVPVGRGHTPDDSFTGAAGGAACGDLVRVSLACDDGTTITGAGFDASGCGAAIAAGSATVALVSGRPLLYAARVGAAEIAAELGGLSPHKMHAAELAADALHRALGAVARARAALGAVDGRALVAMSGGVDSAVAALLCARDAAADPAAAPVAVTLELWSDAANDGDRSCCSAQAVRGARAVAHGLGLPHFSLDLRDEFRAGVVDPWLDDHAAGLTPNPCVRCNGFVRLDAMLDLAESLGCEALATGHYARVAAGGPPLLRTAADPAKDQSYMLAAMAPESIARMRFPLGDLHKPEVRELAADAGLSVARKPDSQDLCFLAGTGRAAFLERHGARRAGAPARSGDIVDRRGRVLGRHRGHTEYTVGQRRGLGLGAAAAQDVPAHEPLYVLATDARSNTVTVGAREDLLTSEVALRDAVFHLGPEAVDRVRLRYRSRPVPAAVALGPDGAATATLAEPVLGAAPGQTAVLMAGDLVAGHATIAAYTPARAWG